MVCSPVGDRVGVYPVNDELDVLRFTIGPFEENAYLVIGPSGRKAILVDPGLESEVLLEEIGRRRLDVALILNTHAHLDHAAGNAFFCRETGAPLALHPLDRPLLESLPAQAAAFGFQMEPSPRPDLDLEEGRPILFDGVELRVLHTPGHTPGGVSLELGRRVIVGDTLFRGSVGRTDLPGGSWRSLVDSIRDKLFRLPGDTVCLPGHGPETTIEQERRSNPFVSDAAALGLWVPGRS